MVAKAKREAEGRISLSAEWSVEGNCWIVADAFTMHGDDEVRTLHLTVMGASATVTRRAYTLQFC